VSVLSGGEKSRLALSKMLLTPSNLLVLDEPTNHLDMRSKAVLQDALSRYKGSFLIVSHDRDFLEPLVNKCIDLRERKARITLGAVSDYLRKRADEQQAAKAPRDVAGKVAERKQAQHSDRDRKREEADRRQARYKRIKPLKNKIDRLEKNIVELEKQNATVEAALADEATYRDEDKARILTKQYRDLTTQLEAAFEEWESAQAEIKRIDGEFE
jgi:ATP-binding cassette subfamily F protein 3